ncbi:MAG: hypothetical protein JNM28_06125 [Armatimonadetes bacterium]|nr:hypothetical protein [Armatimonadota bacterium]MBS1711580.1 hypothetical protein [Armatimonadota bacterium]MBX3109865.1 hypothetical protein [Fimbriimonadaceae bacterium]
MAKILPLAMILAGVACCSPDPTPKWVGEWKGEDKTLVSDAEAAKDPVIAGTLRMVKLSFKQDRTFALFVAGMPYEGRYSVQGADATLTITKILGKPIENEPAEIRDAQTPVTATMQSAGTIRLTGYRFGSESILLQKQEPK